MKDYITKIREWIHSHIPLTKRKKKHFSTASVVALTTGGMLVVIMICFVQYRQYAGIPLHVLDDSSIAFSGYNGNGVVKDGFHPEQAMLDQLSLTIEQKDASGESTIYLSQLKDSIVCGFNKDSGLSNDEVITYSCTIDKELARNAGYQLVNTQKNYKVEGLAELTPVDPFLDVAATWTMQDGIADMHLTIPDNLLSLGITYTWEAKDETTITLTAAANTAQLQEAGYMLTATTKDYVVGTKPVLIETLDELSDTEIDTILAEAETLLVQELETCGYALAHDEQTLVISGYEEGNIRESYDGFTISFPLIADNLPWYSRFSDLTAEFTGTIYRDSSSVLHFESRTKHSCSVDGFFSLTMEETANP